MYYFDGVIVVEGKGDVSYLSSFINSEYVILNGYDIPESTVDYLRNIKTREIVVLTDPDEAGITIEKKLREKGFNYTFLKVDISKCNKKGKHGIAECEKDEIIKVFGEKLVQNSVYDGTISLKDFSNLGLMDSKIKQAEVAKSFHLGVCNTKTLFKRLNYNKISVEDIKELWK